MQDQQQPVPREQLAERVNIDMSNKSQKPLLIQMLQNLREQKAENQKSDLPAEFKSKENEESQSQPKTSKSPFRSSA